ncbi:predicted protein [Chaetomium globosum CBS 148.51]|uniref:Uncharacterized protein n=1 Tax=Chaetomium globosum (strain ATCC 6205 / CBS 148.51 / DSM 1962 / NBRC 6347 / NRRL 1970) TaxID=306901 RepID=Q2H1E0_CHAGB|nr:uncharacterized protein CHGG_04406 [Chaetomium globosum CBS 148.51]EAQ87787.1 predicted protein [Chaetomium globosum CBS 148.51]
MSSFEVVSSQVASSRAVSPEGQPKAADPEAKSMAQEVAARTFIIAIVVTATGICLLSLLAYWFFVTRRRKLRQQARKNNDEEKNLNAGTTPSPTVVPSAINTDRDPVLALGPSATDVQTATIAPHGHPSTGTQAQCHVPQCDGRGFGTLPPPTNLSDSNSRHGCGLLGAAAQVESHRHHCGRRGFGTLPPPIHPPTSSHSPKCWRPSTCTQADDHGRHCGGCSLDTLTLPPRTPEQHRPGIRRDPGQPAGAQAGLVEPDPPGPRGRQVGPCRPPPPLPLPSPGHPHRPPSPPPGHTRRRVPPLPSPRGRLAGGTATTGASGTGTNGVE